MLIFFKQYAINVFKINKNYKLLKLKRSFKYKLPKNSYLKLLILAKYCTRYYDKYTAQKFKSHRPKYLVKHTYSSTRLNSFGQKLWYFA